MSVLLINGGRKLEGEIDVHGAKNSILPILAATIINGGTSVLHNCPELSDVDASIEILRHLGCSVSRESDKITVDSSGIKRFDIPDQLMREMRSSVVFLGAVLARTGNAVMSFPGGCELGPVRLIFILKRSGGLGRRLSMPTVKLYAARLT
jgi:UDP-N-acetylglucosamine 1-carboxyvinyltransferase